MYAIHSAEVAVWICVEDPQAGRAPCTSKVNPEATVVRERVADPVSARPPRRRYDVAAIVEIPHGDAAALTGATADGFDDERVFSGVWRPWDAYEKGELGDRVRDTHDLVRKSHLIAPSSLTSEYTDQYITDSKNPSCTSFTLFDQRVVNQFSFAFIPIYLVSIVPIYLHRTG
jgi:hypothetical protein